LPSLFLDDLFEQEEIKDAALMKVDIQGAEKLIITGGNSATWPVTGISYIEVCRPEITSNGSLLSSVWSVMFHCNTRRGLLGENALRPIMNATY
jgi:hypothetical protein